MQQFDRIYMGKWTRSVSLILSISVLREVDVTSGGIEHFSSRKGGGGCTGREAKSVLVSIISR